MAEFSIIVSFIAGILSFLSPCVLPLVPAYLTFLAKSSSEEISNTSKSNSAKIRIFLSSVCFVLGFSIIFSVIGVLLQSALSSVASDVRIYLGYLGGLIIIVFGLLLTGLLEIPALSSEHKLRFSPLSNTYISSFIFGAAFAVGWTPCVGAVLGSILTLAVTQPALAFPLMLSYSLGLGIPFLIAGAFISVSREFIKKLTPYLKTLNLIFGIILIVLGILVFTGTLSSVANFDFVNQYLLR